MDVAQESPGVSDDLGLICAVDHDTGEAFVPAADYGRLALRIAELERLLDTILDLIVGASNPPTAPPAQAPIAVMP